MASNVEILIVHTISQAKVTREAFVTAMQNGGIAIILGWEAEKAIKDERKGILAAELLRDISDKGLASALRQSVLRLQKSIIEEHPWESRSSSAMVNTVEMFKASATAEWLHALNGAIDVDKD